MTLTQRRIMSRWALVACFLLGLLALPWAGQLMQNPFLFAPIAAETAVGVLVSRRRPENPIGWVFLGVGALSGLLSAAVGLVALAGQRGGPSPWWGLLGAWAGSWLFPPLLYVMTTLTILLYPSGLLTPRWRPVLWVSLAGVGGIVAVQALQPTLEVAEPGPEGLTPLTVDNPLSPFTGSSWITGVPVLAVFAVVSLLCGLAAVASSVLRTRRARGVERLQMRWFSFAVAVIALEIALEIVSGLSGHLVLAVIEVAAFSFVPVACGIAILRYRLYEIDRIISRTASYALVTGVLLTVYFVIVTSLTTLLPQSSNGFAVAAATLAAAAAFRPLLVRVQRAVDRRFDRERYDGLRAAEAFSARLRDETDPAAVSAEMAAVVQRTLQPGRLLLWIPGDVADER